MSRTRSFDRITLYRRICLRAGITPAKTTLGYFTKNQMKDLALYMDRVVELFDKVDIAHDNLLRRATARSVIADESVSAEKVVDDAK